MGTGKPLTRALRWLRRSDPGPQGEADAPAPTGPSAIADVADRERATLRGRIAVLTLRPRSGTPWLEAEFTDGSGTLTLIWMGRRDIPGVTAGRELEVTGRVSWVDGRRRMYNPYYQLR
ncbi:MAG: OB-fold nucleic acid binding domain-containing protein [Micropruina sp.]